MRAIFHHLFGLFSKAEKRELVFMFLAVLLGAIVDMAGVASIMPFMAVVANPSSIETNQWLNQVYGYLGFSTHQSFLMFLGVTVLVLLVLTNCLKALINWWTLSFDNRLNASLATRLLARYMGRPYAFFLNRNTSDMGRNVLADVRTVIVGVLSAGMSALSGAVSALLLLALLFAVNARIALTIAFVLVGSYAAIYLFARAGFARIGRSQVHANTMKYKLASEALGGIKDLKVLGREKDFLDRFAVYAYRHARDNVMAGVISQIPRYALEVIAFGGILSIVLYFLGSTLNSAETVSLLALYAFAGYRLLPAVQQIFAGIATVRVTAATLDILHEDMTSGDAPNGAFLQESRAAASPMPFTRSIELKALDFRYEGAPELVLRGLDLKIMRNTTVGLVGATGSGKTTTVDIILGLLAPSGGKLLVDDVEVTGERIRNWQCNLGYVPQHIFLCDDTIAANIAIGVREEDIDMFAVLRAARIANLHRFVESELPNGYATVVGERGVRLSGGQRQRIGIARALYRDPAVLIMDEATSALDGITEEAVMDALNALTGEKTIILIAHRLTTVKDCDVIYLLDRGAVLASGSHDELMHSSSWFRAAAGVAR